MSNKHLNISMIAKETLARYKNKLGFTKGANRQYSSEFAKSGAKIGNVINVRLPHQFEAKDGAALQLQNTTDRTVALTLDTQKHVGFQFSSSELTLNIDEFGDRYIDGAVEALANATDVAGLLMAKKSVFNSVGVPGTPPANSAAALKLALQAGQKMNEFACPTGKRTMLLSPSAEVEFVSGLSGMFNSQKELAKQYEKGVMGEAAGFLWKMSQNVPAHTIGSFDGAAVKTTITQNGATEVEFDGGTTAGGTIAGYLKAGDVITFEGRFAVNPITKESTGSLMQFVVTEDAACDNSGEGKIKVSPAIYIEGPYKNVSAAPTDGDVIKVFAQANDTLEGIVSYANLAYHKDAFVVGFADLDLPGGVDMAARATDAESGISLRVVRQYDINTDTWPCRVDVLFGWKAFRPEWACRLHI